MVYVSGGEDWTFGNTPETLRLIKATETSPGAEYLAFSHCWGRTADMRFKLIALKGAEDEVTRVMRFTYLRGLWRERLLTDLLWFAIEGPGQRLLRRTDGAGEEEELSLPVAPTWSWASLEGAVALDLLPENSLQDVKLVAALTSVEACGPSSDSPDEMTITLKGPLLPVSALKIGAAGWEIHIGDAGEATAKVFPDVKEPDIYTMSGLVCLSFLVLKRSKERSLIPASSEDVQGLLLRKVRGSGGSEGSESSAGMDVYERVGYFTTSYIAKSRTASRGRKALEQAPVKTMSYGMG